jgi:hypothetical protein
MNTRNPVATAMMGFRRLRSRPLLRLLAILFLLSTPALAATLNFTVNTSEPVTVTGSPRIAIDVGGVTRYATYASGSGTAALTFSYAVQPGDFDANGIALASPLELNGGSIADLAGNPATALSFTLPDTSGINVQTYAAAFTTSPITNANANAVSFAIAQAPIGSSFSYTIASSGGSGSVTGSGTIGSNAHTVSGVDVSALPSGTLTLSVTLSTAAGGTGAAKTATSTPAFTGVLESMSAPAAAFSVRRLGRSYAGALLRVRRASDNAEQDIGATLSGDINAAAMASFCSSSSCLVSRWYDQSGNGRNAGAITLAAQPLVMNGGMLNSVGGRPALSFNGHYLLAASWGAVAQPFTRSYVATRRNASSVNAHIVNSAYESPNTADWNLFSSSLISQYTDQVGPSVSFVNNETAVFASIYNGASSALAKNGLPTVGNPGPGGFAGISIGSAGNANKYFAMDFAELLVFPVALSTGERQALERSQGSYYGVTVP